VVYCFVTRCLLGFVVFCFVWNGVRCALVNLVGGRLRVLGVTRWVLVLHVGCFMWLVWFVVVWCFIIVWLCALL